MSDPVRDLRDELTALRAEIDVQDARVEARFDRIEADLDRLEGEHRTFVNRSWAMVVLVLTAAAGGFISLVTRQP